MNSRVLPENDPYREAAHRDAARQIVKKDRSRRKLGITVDTAGAIAHALGRAYRQGFADGQAGRSVAPKPPETKEPKVIDWILIPPRPRGAFWNVCLFVLGDDGNDKRAGYLVPALTARQTPGWRLILPDWKDDDKIIGAASIAPLLKLGLLVEDSEHSDRLVISEAGKITWREFCERGGKFPDDLTVALQDST